MWAYSLFRGRASAPLGLSSLWDSRLALVVALNSLIISVLVQLTGAFFIPVSCTNTLNYSYLSATGQCANQPRVQTCDALSPDLRRIITRPATFPAGG